MKYVIEVKRVNPEWPSDYSSITINGLEVGLGQEKACNDLAEELRQDDSRAKMLYEYWLEDERKKANGKD